MALFKESELRGRARDQPRGLYKSAAAILTEKVTASSHLSQFDIFLSHSLNDQELILGIWLYLEDMGYKVYVDWIHDHQLNRNSVTKETARLLRQRMSQCKSLFFVTTTNSSNSKWMPWELGFKDGDNGKAAILPVAQKDEETYMGQEYLGIYPYVTKSGSRLTPTTDRLWIRTTSTCYTLFDRWVDGEEPYEH